MCSSDLPLASVTMDKPESTDDPTARATDGGGHGPVPVLRRLDEAGRYELDLDGVTVAHATFHRLATAAAGANGGVIVIPHTEVDPARRGHGIGALLVGAVLDDVRRRGERVVPRCWYVGQYLDEHPEHLDLVATV